MKAEGINGWKYLEHWYLKIIKMYLTQEWALIQGGKDSYAVRRWLDIMLLLEVDLKAQKELMLLAQSGDVGRTCANKVVWDLLSTWGLMYEYGDVSHKISAEVQRMRQRFDRPPQDHPDMKKWSWHHYDSKSNIRDLSEVPP